MTDVDDEAAGALEQKVREAWLLWTVAQALEDLQRRLAAFESDKPGLAKVLAANDECARAALDRAAAAERELEQLRAQLACPDCNGETAVGGVPIRCVHCDGRGFLLPSDLVKAAIKAERELEQLKAGHFFWVDAEQWAKYVAWRDDLERRRPTESGPIGGRYTFCFTPTSIGTVVKVRAACGRGEVEEIDISGYEDW